MKSYIVLLVLIMVSCYSNAWNQLDQEDFKKDCMDEGGSVFVCNCILECIEREYANYEEALKQIQHSQLKDRLQKCLMDCNESAN